MYKLVIAPAVACLLDVQIWHIPFLGYFLYIRTLILKSLSYKYRVCIYPVVGAPIVTTQLLALTASSIHMSTHAYPSEIEKKFSFVIQSILWFSLDSVCEGAIHFRDKFLLFWSSPPQHHSWINAIEIKRITNSITITLPGVTSIAKHHTTGSSHHSYLIAAQLFRRISSRIPCVGIAII